MLDYDGFNTRENKRRFFAMYYGQLVKPAADGSLLRLEAFHLDYLRDDDHLVLKKYPVKPDGPRHADYLRQKGYCIGWHDLSVSDVERFGWCKLVGDGVSYYPENKPATL